jgi:hypothetical protein
VFVSVGVGGRGAWAEWPSAQPAPARARLPTLLLLDPVCFHQLFTLMQALAQMKEPGPNAVSILSYYFLLYPGQVWLSLRFEKILILEHYKFQIVSRLLRPVVAFSSPAY